VADQLEIMLPNHAPLMAAEQFGTLAPLYPGRIDLGVGRAPGTETLRAPILLQALSSKLDAGEREMEAIQMPMGHRHIGNTALHCDVSEDTSRNAVESV
jgi:hypothetical protein